MGTDEPVAWGQFDDAFVTELADFLVGQRVLEVFAGNGLLASKLAARGVTIRATSRFSGHDGHALGFHWPVEELVAHQAVQTYRNETDVLLMSWPTADEGALAAALAWGAEKPIVFIGEMADPSLEMGGFPGCASDLFFEMIDVNSTFASYSPRNRLERAVVLQLSDDRVRAWAKEERSLRGHSFANGVRM